jgi:hypothetical protein
LGNKPRAEKALVVTSIGAIGSVRSAGEDAIVALLGTLLDVTRAKCLTNGVDIIREVFNGNECVSILERRNIERVRPKCMLVERFFFYIWEN